MLAALEFACRDGEIEIDSFAYVFFQKFAETAVVELCDFDSKRRGSVRSTTVVAPEGWLDSDWECPTCPRQPDKSKAPVNVNQ